MNLETLRAHFELVANAQTGVGSFFFGFTDQLNTGNFKEAGNIKSYPVIQWVPPGIPETDNYFDNIHQSKRKGLGAVFYCWRQRDINNNVELVGDTLEKGWDETEILLAQFVRKAFQVQPKNPLGLQIANGGRIDVEYGLGHNDVLIGTKFKFNFMPSAICADGIFDGSITW